MRLLFLSGNPQDTGGWATYSDGFITQARARYGRDAVSCPVLSSLDDGWQLVSRRLPVDVVQLRQLARRCDLIHALVEPTAPLAWALARLARKPYLISTHGTYADLDAYPRYQRGAIRSIFAGASSACQSARTRVTSFAAASEPRSRSGWSGGFVPTRAVTRPTNKIPRLLSVGLLKPRKGFHTLIAALAELRRRAIRLRCDIVGPIGSAAYRVRLEGAIRAGGLTGDVAIRGKLEAESSTRCTPRPICSCSHRSTTESRSRDSGSSTSRPCRTACR